LHGRARGHPADPAGIGQGVAALEQRCASLRSEYALLASGVPIIKSNERGERVYMEDATRDTRMGQIQDEMRACP
jgi:hypothetical protein